MTWCTHESHGPDDVGRVGVPNSDDDTPAMWLARAVQTVDGSGSELWNGMLRGCCLPGRELHPHAAGSVTLAGNSAWDRIRTGGPLRDSALNAAPLAWLGYPRTVH